VRRPVEGSRRRSGEAVSRVEVANGPGEEGSGTRSSSDRDQLSEDCTLRKVTGAACVAELKLPPYKKRGEGGTLITLRGARTRRETKGNGVRLVSDTRNGCSRRRG
jgi:hypothetical protein